MATVTPPRKPPTPRTMKTETLADLVDRLGGIPLRRILAKPPAGKAKLADVLRVHDKEGRLCELVDGTLVEKTMGYEESFLTTELLTQLQTFVRPRNLGLVTGPDGMMEVLQSLVRIPDIAFVEWSRLPGRKKPKEPIPPIAPNLAVEVLSKSNTRAEMKRKRAEYFKAGTQQVWEVEPKKRTVRVYGAAEEFITLTESDTLNGGDVLPGFELPLKDLFAELDRQG